MRNDPGWTAYSWAECGVRAKPMRTIAGTLGGVVPVPPSAWPVTTPLAIRMTFPTGERDVPIRETTQAVAEYRQAVYGLPIVRDVEGRWYTIDEEPTA